MKKLLLISTIILLFSCGEEKSCKYKVGDVVYLKPDSTQVVIRAAEDGEYMVDRPDWFMRHQVSEKLIY